MKRFVIGIVGFYFAAILVASAGDTFEEYRSKFVGKWMVEQANRVTKVDWKNNGTWSSETVDKGRVVLKLSGVWWAKENKLHGVCLKANIPEIPLGVDDASLIVEITEDYYVIKNWRGIEKKYMRVKADG